MLSLWQLVAKIAVLTIVLYINIVGALRPLANDKRYVDTDLDDVKVLKTSLHLLRALSKTQNSRRISPDNVIAKEKNIEVIKRKLNADYNNNNAQSLRGAEDEPLVDDVKIIEKELLHTLSENKPASLQRPFVEKTGINDFLVMKPDLFDPFVTVVPNAIYYGIEKKCVNWLDDCSLRGIRSKLLMKVKWPA